ncbi:flagellar basal body P-ring formation protein FlgA [Yersinia sp. 2105 StPb PI]|nr:flagella basal body P-ring formation protein FlgA [Yersinia frederiksenii]RXA94483.1 flagellar basal body P-ring formation protein FlgA [Yersinia sp. 2105 StPb PI]CNI15310.1 flagellar basal body P-ring biosynthesis protein FlgA [Yersinia frederiksenii]CNI43713.1 flagellar basal body P-ring biosynthesis protein FlgA [Yersinia frederiksenii]CNK71528.1 flagellar basal body P-ring biosynthesis protein FlgA [Yersinia frederiksenii]
MFLLRGFFILSLVFLCCFKVLAASAENESLTAKITALVSSQNGIPADTSVLQTIKILTPPEQLDSLCPNPELSLAGNNTRLTGKRSVIAQCGNKRKFVQISVQAQGTWWSARHAIKPGVVIQSEDIESRTGSLERLPAGLIFNKEHIIGQTTTRSISPGNPVLQNQLRARWAIMSGQAVEVIATGPGFRIRAKGKALDNAALGESLRITMRSGKIMTGVVSSEGKVDMNLEE